MNAPGTEKIERVMGFYVREAENHLKHMRCWANYPALAELFRARGIPLGYWSYPDPNDPCTLQDPEGQYEVRLETTKPDSRQGNFDLVVTNAYDDRFGSQCEVRQLQDAVGQLYDSDFGETDILHLYQDVLTLTGVTTRFVEYDETSGTWPACEVPYLRIESFGQGQGWGQGQ